MHNWPSSMQSDPRSSINLWTVITKFMLLHIEIITDEAMLFISLSPQQGIQLLVLIKAQNATIPLQPSLIQGPLLWQQAVWMFWNWNWNREFLLIYKMQAVSAQPFSRLLCFYFILHFAWFLTVQVVAGKSWRLRDPVAQSDILQIPHLKWRAIWKRN